MEPPSLTLEDRRLLQAVSRAGAVIIRAPLGPDFAAYPRGDRRKRPVCWITYKRVKGLAARGLLVTENGTQYVPVMPEDDAYIPPEKRAPKASVLETLSRTRAGREPFLKAHHIHAAHRLARDYARANFRPGQALIPDGSAPSRRKTGTGQESAMAGRVDAQGRIRAAETALGPALMRVLSGVVAQEKSLNEIETENEWQDGAARPVIRLALTELAQHYEAARATS